MTQGNAVYDNTPRYFVITPSDRFLKLAKTESFRDLT